MSAKAVATAYDESHMSTRRVKLWRHGHLRGNNFPFYHPSPPHSRQDTQNRTSNTVLRYKQKAAPQVQETHETGSGFPQPHHTSHNAPAHKHRIIGWHDCGPLKPGTTSQHKGGGTRTPKQYGGELFSNACSQGGEGLQGTDGGGCRRPHPPSPSEGGLYA